MHAVRISTLNAWALPGFISSHVTERIPAIVEQLDELDVDVAAFQEVWTPQARRLFIEGGRRLGMLPAWSEDKSSGGLFVLSRVPVRRTRFTQYRLSGLPQRLRHADYYGRKGFAEVEIETSRGPLVLVVTHLHARYAGPGEYDEYLGIRAAQVAQLAAALVKLETPTVAVGDFNFREEGPEYHAFTRLAGFVDAAAALQRRLPTSLAGNSYRGVGHQPDERIDYVFTRSGAKVSDLRRRFDQPLVFGAELGAYSDHAGLLADVMVTEGSTESTVLDPASVGLLATLMTRGRSEARRRRRNQRRWGVALLAVALLGRRRLSSTVTKTGTAAGAGLLLFAESVASNELSGYDEVEKGLRAAAGG